jgi:WD40 repeat protein
MCTLDSDPKQEVVFFWWSPDGKYILTSTEDYSVRLWETDGRCVKSYRFPGDPRSYRISPDGGKIATYYHYNTGLRVWSLTTGESLAEFSSHFALCDFAFSPDGRQLLAVAPGYVDQVRLWDIDTRQVRFVGAAKDFMKSDLSRNPWMVAVVRSWHRGI